jgi:CBS-domain-containing membrane protein
VLGTTKGSHTEHLELSHTNLETFTENRSSTIIINSTPWPESASELYRPSDRRLAMKLVPDFADRGCHVVSVTDPYGRILGFLDRTNYYDFINNALVSIKR